MQNMQNTKIQINPYFKDLQEILCIHKYEVTDSFVTMDPDVFRARTTQIRVCTVCNKKIKEEALV